MDTIIPSRHGGIAEVEQYEGKTVTKVYFKTRAQYKAYIRRQDKAGKFVLSDGCDNGRYFVIVPDNHPLVKRVGQGSNP